VKPLIHNYQLKSDENVHANVTPAEYNAGILFDAYIEELQAIVAKKNLKTFSSTTPRDSQGRRILL
jgi:hypothetical protein